MKLSDEIYEKKIWPYLDGSIDPSGKVNFEKEIKSNPDLAKEVEECRKMISNLHYLGAEHTINNWFPRPQTKLKKAIIFFKNPRNLGIAASIAVLLVAGSGFWYVNRKEVQLSDNIPPVDSTNVRQKPDSRQIALTPEELLTNNLQLPIENEPAKFKGIVDKINNGNVASVINDLAEMNQRHSDTKPDTNLYGSSGEGDKSVKPETSGENLSEGKDYQNLYLGIAYLKSGRFNEALKALNSISKVKVKGEADWYRALTYLGLKNTKKAMEITKTVAADNANPHQGAAALLLEELIRSENEK